MLDSLVNLLKTDEGFRPYVYDDATGEAIVKGYTVKGYATVGYGFMLSADKGGEIPMPIAEQWLLHEASHKWWALTEKMPWLLDQPEDAQVGIANMAYQMGVSGLLRFKRMLAALEAGDRHRAAECALDSKWARQTPNRAGRVAALIRGE